MKIIILFLVCIVASTAQAKEVYRPASSGDRGTYYVLESKDLGSNIIEVLSSRVGKGNAYTDFTKLKVNCSTKQYFELAGGSTDGAQEKPTKPLKDWSKNSKWTNLVTGSSKYDLVNYICRKHK